MTEEKKTNDYPKYYKEEEAYFPYIDNLDEDVNKQVLEAAQSAIRMFNIPQTQDGRELAASINKVVDEILRTGEFPKEYYDNDITLVAVELGCLYGYALMMGYGWQWRKIGKSPDELVFSFAVVSPDDNWVNPCGVYLGKILTGKNYGIDGKNDNTCLLVYNMIEDHIKKQPARKLTVLL